MQNVKFQISFTYCTKQKSQLLKHTVGHSWIWMQQLKRVVSALLPEHKQAWVTFIAYILYQTATAQTKCITLILYRICNECPVENAIESSCCCCCCWWWWWWLLLLLSSQFRVCTQSVLFLCLFFLYSFKNQLISFVQASSSSFLFITYSCLHWRIPMR